MTNGVTHLEKHCRLINPEDVGGRADDNIKTDES